MNRQVNTTKLSIEATFHVTQRMLDSLQILQMDRLTLEEYIAEQLMENPVLNYPTVAAVRQKKDAGNQEDRRRPEQADHTNYYETLEFFLSDQLSRLNVAEPIKQFCRKLIPLIDKNGYLEISQLPQSYTCNDLFLDTLAVLQSLEPAGVAARDLKECLLLQLQRLGEENGLAVVLIRDHLEDLSRRNIAKIQRITGASAEELQNAFQCILALNPRPGADFAVREETAYVLPDFVLACNEGKITVTQEERSFPSLSINDYYRNLYETTRDPEVKRYLKDRIVNARNVITGLENRKTTALRCVEAILEIQRSFFLNQSRQLVPMTQKDIAKILDLHISTVSRAVSGKHLEFDSRVYPLKFFFARGVANVGEGIATGQIRELIRQIVQNEDLEHPLSDQQIVSILQQGGAAVSRRTVAKYREQMGIPSSKQRRKI